MPCYFIVTPEVVMDPAMYGEYCSKVDAVVEMFGGRYLAVDKGPEVIAGGWSPSKVVIIEFPDKKAWRTWWDSAEYGKIKHLRERSAKVNAVLVNGLCVADID